uniref:Signal peptide, CUB and EGF-like domain-containing protein 1 n=1 Tax=Magallana gigas TaxID=29159 RepID=K1Q7Y4_MAGGI
MALYFVSTTSSITLTEQVLPIKLWGQHYVVLPSGNPDDKQIILIQTAQSNTDVHILGYDYVTVPNRFLSIQRRIMGTLPVTIKSSKPVSVSQVLFSVNETESVMVNIVPVKYSVEKSTLQNSSVFEYGYLKNSGLEGCFKVPLSQYTYDNGSFDTLPDTVYGCTIMDTSASEPLYPRTNCGDWNDSKTDNPWPTMTPGDGVDNNDNDQVDEEDCYNFETLFVIPTPDVDSLTLHCPIMNDNEASFSYDKGMQWSETTGNGSTSNQIPGDQIDNDQDGLIDEEYCGLLWGDTDVLDVDLDGSLNEDCKAICEEGMELDNVTRTCRPCLVGYYKDISANDTEKSVTERFWCKKCPENKTTYTSGTVDGGQCIDHCGVGMYLEGNGCYQCAVGFFKNTSSEMSELREELRWNCSQCPEGQTTNSTGADKCIAICEEGMELDNVTRTCRPCLVGYYKDISANNTEKNVTERFWCKKCPENKTTYTSGTVDGGQCIAICEEGMELDNVTRTCRPCLVGYYKDISANDTEKNVRERFWCKKCPKNKTTYTNGTVDGGQCIDHCGVGMYLEGNGCYQCAVGFFKNTSSEMSELREELRWNCSQCPEGQTTNSTGADKCIENCLKGNEYNSTTRKCDPCNHGFFKNISGNHIDCYQCPVNHTTKVLGATDITQCKPAGCMCPCNMVHTPKNFTDEELTKNIEEMKKKLAVNKQQLSSSIRKKISVKDDRPSAKAVGSVGVVILAVCFGLLIALDYVTLTRHILGLLRVIRNLFLRN